MFFLQENVRRILLENIKDKNNIWCLEGEKTMKNSEDKFKRCILVYFIFVLVCKVIYYWKWMSKMSYLVKYMVFALID